MKKVLTVSGIILFFVLVYKLSKGNTTSTVRNANLPNGTDGNNNTGGGNTGTGGETGGGTPETNFFRFYQKTNSNPYPTTDPVQVPVINGYVAFQFASWSIVSLTESQQNASLQSWIEFKMFDSANNLVCHIKNTQANYHPNFAQYFPAGTDLRHNNHAYQYRKYIPFGTYRIEHSNISPQPIEQNLRLGTQGEGGNVYSKINQKVGVGTHTFTVEINEVINQLYEYDCNPYSF